MKKYAIGVVIIVVVSFGRYFFLQPGLLSGGEGMREPSKDVGELRKYIEVEDGISNLKWELFGTPEWSGGVPGPTDYATIIFTGEAIGVGGNSDSLNEKGYHFVPVNSDRLWLNEEQRMIIKSLISGDKIPPFFRCVAHAFNSTSVNNMKFDGVYCRYRQEVISVVLLKQPS